MRFQHNARRFLAFAPNDSERKDPEVPSSAPRDLDLAIRNRSAAADR